MDLFLHSDYENSYILFDLSLIKGTSIPLGLQHKSITIVEYDAGYSLGPSQLDVQAFELDCSTNNSPVVWSLRSMML